VRLCQGAVDLDPAFARAWALMAVCQGASANFSNEAGDAGWTAAERALAIDPDLAEAHAAKAIILTYDGRYDEAQAEMAVALRLDPVSPDVNNSAATLATATRRYAEAIGFCEAASAADAADCGASFMAIQCHEALGDLAGARAASTETLTRIEKALAAEPDNGNLLGFGVVALTILGENDRAKAWAEQALLVEPDNGLVQYNLACAMVRAGQTDFALDLLQKSLSQGGRGNLVWAEADSDLDPLRDLPRYKTIVAEAEARYAAAEADKPAA
jgi:adenylate cyclase